MAYTTPTQVPGPVNVIYQQKMLRNARVRAPYFAGSMASEIAEHAGSFTAKWRSVANLTPTTTALTPLSGTASYPTRTGSQASATDITATVSKYGDYIRLNEEVDLVNPNNHTAKYVEVLGIQAGQSLNRLQRNELEDNSTLYYGGGVVNDDAVVTKLQRNDVRHAVNQLNNASALRFTGMTAGSTNVNTTPIRSAFLGLCHVDVEEDVRDITTFIPSEQYASQTQLFDGEFGSVDGVRFVASEDASIDVNAGGAPGGTLRSGAGAKADLYSTVIFGMEYHGSVGLGSEHIKEIYEAGDQLPGVQMISKAKGSAGTADPLNEEATLAWKSWHAAKILQSSWGLAIRSGATDL